VIGAAARRLRVAACLGTAALFIAACVSPNSQTCRDGLVCPPGSSCDENGSHGLRCITRAQKVNCEGHNEGAYCGDNDSGTCRGGACEAITCGNGRQERGELCDGAPPFGETCLDHGFDRGLLGCTDACQPDVMGCKYLGWHVAKSLTADVEVAGIWASEDDVFAVGASPGGTPFALHWDGAVWAYDLVRLGDAEKLYGVGGSSADDVFAVGMNGIILHRNQTAGVLGSLWDTLPSGTTADLRAVWAASEHDAFAVGAGGTILRWDGRQWQSMSSGTTEKLLAVWGADDNEVFAVGERDTIVQWNGATWAPNPTGARDAPNLSGVWGSSWHDVYVAGRDSFGGALYHRDGISLKWARVPFDPPPTSLDAVWGSGPDDVFVVGNGADGGRLVLHWDGHHWTAQTVEHAGPLSAICGSGASDVYAVASDGIFVGPGTTSEKVSIEQPFNDVRGSDAFPDVFAVGVAPGGESFGGAIWRWDGAAWSAVPISPITPLPVLGRIWPASPTDLFVISDRAAAGDGFPIIRVTGSGWIALGRQPAPLNAIWGSSANDVFAVGDAGTIVHWNGDTAEITPSGTQADLHGVWGSGAGDVFAVGDDGAVLHWDGTRWETRRSEPGQPLGDVWGSGPKDVYVTGTSGVIHWDGAAWTADPSSLAYSGTLAVAGSGAADVFACGGNTLLHAYLGTWEAIAATLTSCERLYVSRQQVFAVGRNEPGATVLTRHSVSCEAGPERLCDDGWDNDCNGLADIDDPSCQALNPHAMEQCANLADDDGDGLIDCADPDCAQFRPCLGS